MLKKLRLASSQQETKILKYDYMNICETKHDNKQNFTSLNTIYGGLMIPQICFNSYVIPKKLPSVDSSTYFILSRQLRLDLVLSLRLFSFSFLLDKALFCREKP